MLRLRQDILLFPEGRSKAFTLSYDDGVTQDRQLIGLLRKYRLQCTFNLNSGLMGQQDWLKQPGIDVSHHKLAKEQIRETYQGFDLGVHTMTHPNLAGLPDGAVAGEVVQDKRELEAIVKHPVRGMAYPFGTYTDKTVKVIKKCGIAYARTVRSTKTFALPNNFLKWHPSCHHTEGCLEQLAEQFLALDGDKCSQPQLFFVWGHAYEFEALDEWERIENFFKKMAFHSDIWYAANIEIYDYIKAAKRLIYSTSGEYIYNPGIIDVWLRIDGMTYRIPSGETVTIKNAV